MLFGTLIIYPLSHFFSKWLNLTRGICHGGSVAEWLGRRTINPEVTVSSPALTT